MTTVVCLGDRLVADTRASLEQKDFVGVGGDKVLYNDETIKIRTFTGDYLWDETTRIQMVGFAGTLQTISKFVKFMDNLVCPMEQFLITLDRMENGSLYDILGLQKTSNLIICLNDGRSIRLSIGAKNHVYRGPDFTVKAVGSGAFYFDALSGIFELDPELLFRIAISADQYSSKDSFVEGRYDKDKGKWFLHKELLKYDKKFNVDILVNGFIPNIKALLSNVGNDVLDKSEAGIEEPSPQVTNATKPRSVKKQKM